MSGEDFRRELLASGLLVDGGVPGLYHRSERFERVVRAVGDYVAAAGRDEPAHRLHLGPLEARSTLEGSGYHTSFPNLVGVISSFSGTQDDVAGFLEHVEGGGSWLDATAPTDTALCSAGCHPVYPLLADRELDEHGERFDIETWCYRHEPSDDPARLQAFRQHEFVYVGTPQGALAHRDRWVERGRALLGALGLDVDVQVANDPFFGRAGRLLAANQRTKELKFELLVPLSSDVPGAAASSNYHEDHFGVANRIGCEGRVAHSSCIGFGLERCALALLLRHGLRSADWPDEVRRELGLDDGRRP